MTEELPTKEYFKSVIYDAIVIANGAPMSAIISSFVIRYRERFGDDKLGQIYSVIDKAFIELLIEEKLELFKGGYVGINQDVLRSKGIIPDEFSAVRIYDRI